MKHLLLAFLLVATTACSPEFAAAPSVSDSRPTPLLPDANMRAFVQDMFGRCGAKHSEARSTLLRNQIARIVSERIEGEAAQQQFVLMLCIESQFQQGAKSSVGAVGISQLMPQYAQGFATSCGLGVLGKDDIQDVETNLTLGACFFNSLVKEIKNIPLASAAYNSGLTSSAVKGLRALKTGNAETMGYVAKLAVMKAEGAGQ